MWQAIQASGREMVLTVEGNPDDALMSAGGLGNAKRVGHDISPIFGSMLSLIDIASGLWPWPHNGTNTTFGGYYNDLDMLEIGNAPDFVCGQDAASLVRCQTHFSLWTLLKAPLILGGNLSALDAATTAVLVNADALAVNQDPLAVQARRVSSQAPRNATLGGPMDNIAVIARCDASRPTQTWFWKNATQPVRDELFVVPCAAGDAFQTWQFVPAGASGHTALKNAGSGMCVTTAQFDPGLVAPCADVAEQWWARDAASGHVANGGHCLDVYMFTGPDVEIGSCKAPGAQDDNQIWMLSGGALSPKSVPGSCLSVTAGPGGGALRTVDDTGAAFCLANFGGAEGTWGGGDCATQGGLFTPSPSGPPPPAGGPANYTLAAARGGSPSWNSQPGASGPWPHSRYISGYGWSGAGSVFTLDVAAAQTAAGTRVVASDHLGIIDDDLVGGVTRGGDFCLDLVTSGTLEVWAAPLAGGRFALGLFNRSPAPDTISVTWPMFNASAAATFALKDVWAGASLGPHVGGYQATVGAHATLYLIATPA